MPALDGLAGDARHDVDQLIDRDHPILAEVQRLAEARTHEAVDSLDAIVDVAVRAGLQTVAPHLDLAAVGRQRDLTANRRRRLLATSVVGAERSEDVVEANDARLETEVFLVVAAVALHVELLPAVAILGVGRIRVLLFEGRHVGRLLLVPGVDARARRVQVALDAVDTRRLQRMQVDERVVANDHCLVGLDEADAAHVGGKTVNFIDAARGLQAVVPARQVQQLELVRAARFVVGGLDVDAPDPVTAVDQISREMVTNETTRTGY